MVPEAKDVRCALLQCHARNLLACPLVIQHGVSLLLVQANCRDRLTCMLPAQALRLLLQHSVDCMQAS